MSLFTTTNVLLFSAMTLLIPRSSAAIEFDATSNTIMVTGYPENFPCNMTRLSKMDVLCNWGKVSYNETAQTWTVNCNLTIGNNNGTSTYFQIGSKSQPKETVIVNGTVRIKSIWLAGENKEQPYAEIRKLGSVNRLTIGQPEKPEIKARLQIYNDDKRGNKLVIGGYSGYENQNYGGQLHVYNGTIESAGIIPVGIGLKSTWGTFAGGNNGVIMINATFANFSKGFARALTAGLFDGVHFLNSGFSGNHQKIINNCVFENNSIAVNYNGGKQLTLYNCVFKNNKLDWRLYASRIVAVDCVYKFPEKNLYLKRKGRVPYFVSKRHITIKVLNSQKEPVKGAKVQCLPNIPLMASEYDVLGGFTDKNGVTPGKNNTSALLLTQEVVYGPKSKDAIPKVHTYKYSIRIEAAGYYTVLLENYEPVKSWEQLNFNLIRRPAK